MWKTVPKPPKSVFWKLNCGNRVFGFWILSSLRPISVSSIGRYHRYRQGIGIADTCPDTSPDTANRSGPCNVDSAHQTEGWSNIRLHLHCCFFKTLTYTQTPIMTDVLYHATTFVVTWRRDDVWYRYSVSVSDLAKSMGIGLSVVSVSPGISLTLILRSVRFGF